MPLFQLNLTGFRFPDDLPNDPANFRFLADLRYLGHRKQFKTAHAVMPSLDTFRECDRRREDRPNHARDGSDGRFDMTKVDVSERLAFLGRAAAGQSIQFNVLGVSRRDAWDTVKDFLGGVLEGAVGGWKEDLRKGVSGLERGALGAAADDIQSFLLKKLAGGDRVLFRGAADLQAGVGDSNGFRVGDDGAARALRRHGAPAATPPPYTDLGLRVRSFC